MVAKRFFNVGNGLDVVDVEENKNELEKEAIRLSQTQYFYDRFQALAEERNVDIGDGEYFPQTTCKLVLTLSACTELKVTEYLLALEIVPLGTCPSPASNLRSEDLVQHETADYSTVAWLLEPRRQKKSTKWTGTDEHPSYNNNMVGNIITCFTHFIYLHSKQTIVMADVQSM